jgi:CysZ protein
MSNPVAAAWYPIRGLGLIARPRLRRFVIVPLLLNVALFSLAIVYGWRQYEALVAYLETWLPSWLDWLSWLLLPIALAAAATVLFYTFSMLANLIASPFNGLLAEKVEEHLTGEPLPGGGWGKMARELLPTLWDEVKKILYFVAWAVPFLLLFLVPVINVAAPFLWLAFSAWTMALQYVDYPMGNHGIKGPEIRRRLGRRRLSALSFGATTMLLTSIPFVNFLAMPAAVAGATAFWVERFKDEDDGESERKV